LAERKIRTREDVYWADAEGHIENVDGVLKITKICVTYYLKVAEEKAQDARDIFSEYVAGCPAAQSVIGCIEIEDKLMIEPAEKE